MERNPTLRIARPSDNLDALLPFYCDGLGFEILIRFHDHAGFDGVVLGRSGAPYHFEFTHARGQKTGRAPSEDHVAVFYLPDDARWLVASRRMRRAGFDPVLSCNPYWDQFGETFEDPDGYRVVLQRAAWD